MFLNIFINEIKHWLGRPSFYVYSIIFFCIAILISGAEAGLFDSLTSTVGSSRIVNSPYALGGLFAGLTSLIIFLYPSIIGVSIYRDYKCQVHTILYSYPFTKAQYLLAKFFSGIFIVNMIVLFTAIGISLGFNLPGTNPEILTQFELKPYLDVYLIYILPNMLFTGAIVFGIVTFTRNISAGFIFVIIILILQGFLSSFGQEQDNISVALNKLENTFNPIM